MKSVVVLVVLLIITCGFVSAQTGKISGKVIDRSNLQSLINANIMLEGTSIGAISDVNGNYLIEIVPVGAYSLVFSYVGYKKLIIPDVIVKSDKTTVINSNLVWDLNRSNTLTVQAEYFQKAEDSPVSIFTLGQEESGR